MGRGRSEQRDRWEMHISRLVAYYLDSSLAFAEARVPPLMSKGQDQGCEPLASFSHFSHFLVV